MPGVTPEGGRCDRTVDFLSVYPTLMDLVDATPPAHLESASIASLLEDPQASWDRPAITTHGKGNHAIRTERWRYIRYADGSEELYDTLADPLERHNLAGSADLAAVKSELASFIPSPEADPLPRRDRGRRLLAIIGMMATAITACLLAAHWVRKRWRSRRPTPDGRRASESEAWTS